MGLDIFASPDENTEPVSDFSFDILVYRRSRSLWLSSSGEILEFSAAELKRHLAKGFQPVILDKVQFKESLNISPANCLDILELFAFTYPAQFIAPIIEGLALFFNHKKPQNLEEEALCIYHSLQNIFGHLRHLPLEERYKLNNINHFMAQSGWLWAPIVKEILQIGDVDLSDYTQSLKIWDMRDEWEEAPPAQLPLNHVLEPVEVRKRLSQLLGEGAEERPSQQEYALKSLYAMQPQAMEQNPNMVLAEAGTGTGKTLGYIAPASLWVEKNEGRIWLSTYTRNLQRQLHKELTKLYPDPVEKRKHVVVRKGRENYFCFLNYEDLLNLEIDRQKSGRIDSHSHGVGLGLMARWLMATEDGDMIGGDFPAWLIPLLGRHITIELTDTRGECIYSGCKHWRKCFIEHVVRRSYHADIVVSNHALSLIRAAQLGEGEPQSLPSRYIFDEGHHLFDAADNVFSAHFTGVETHELRRWILGHEKGNNRSRLKGLRGRIEELLDDEGLDALAQLEHGARQLPAMGWRARIAQETPMGQVERFLAIIRKQVFIRNPNGHYYDVETQCKPLIDDFELRLSGLLFALKDIIEPTKTLIEELKKYRDEKADILDTGQKGRIDGALSSLDWRIINQLSAWHNMVAELGAEKEIPDGKLSWFAVERRMGREFDMGMHQHYLDPTEHLAQVVFKPAAGVLVTSATLRDNANLPSENEESWQTAFERSGCQWLDAKPQYMSLSSPFDYQKQAKLIVINDVDKNDERQVKAAFRELFLASGGGGLGLFTAITRLKAIYEHLSAPLENNNIRLYAQHVSDIDTGTLIDMFQQNENSCLLGTDAMRDGIDVPGQSLRLLVFDRVPWPRRSLLHAARKKALGGREYEESLVIGKLRQAWGRLIRTSEDKAVFVMLDGAMPSRFKEAFPKEVELKRMGLSEAIKDIQSFLK